MSSMPMTTKAMTAVTASGCKVEITICPRQPSPQEGVWNSGGMKPRRTVQKAAVTTTTLTRLLANSITFFDEKMRFAPFIGLMWSNCSFTVSNENTGPPVAAIPITTATAKTTTSSGTVVMTSTSMAPYTARGQVSANGRSVEDETMSMS